MLRLVAPPPLRPAPLPALQLTPPQPRTWPDIPGTPPPTLPSLSPMPETHSASPAQPMPRTGNVTGNTGDSRSTCDRWPFPRATPELPETALCD
jgi:hypothetical protein